MIIKHNNANIRETQLHDSMTNVGHDPQPWQIKQVHDAATYGVELLWPFDELTVVLGKQVKFEYYLQLSPDFFSITLPGYITVPENHNLFVFPHHTDVSHKLIPPKVVPQMIELDWWPGEIQIIFYMQLCAFRKDEPFAQAMAVPRKEYTLKKMDDTERKAKETARSFLEDNREEYITREQEHQEFATQDNCYEVLSKIQRVSKLPPEIKDQKTTPKPRIKWR